MWRWRVKARLPVMNLSGSVALVTGANRGLGARLVAELLRAGAAKVYATSRIPAPAVGDDRRVQPLRLDVTDPASVAAATAAAPDVTVLVNNAGVLAFGSALTGDLATFERDLDTNYLGTLRVTAPSPPSWSATRPPPSSTSSP
jgi:NAD(P)-dependent dehydrogenase (short-subunit alcohol dehydrogenase family)